MPENRSKPHLPSPAKTADGHKEIQMEQKYPQFVDEAERYRLESGIKRILWEVFSKYDVPKEKA